MAIQELRREALVEPTWVVISRMGVDKCDRPGDAPEAGCTTGSMRHHFHASDDLFVKVFDKSPQTFFDKAEPAWCDHLPAEPDLECLSIVSRRPVFAGGVEF